MSRNAEAMDFTDHNGSLEPVLKDAQPLRRIALDCLPGNLPLPCPVYIQVGERFVKFRETGDAIRPERIVSLSKRGAQWLYVPKNDFLPFIQAIEDIRLPDEAKPDERMRHMRALLSAYTEEIHQFRTPPHRELLEKLRKLADRMAVEVFENPLAVVQHIRKGRDPEVYFVNHAINTAIYGTLIGKSLGYPVGEIKQLCFGCLVHDIGNIFVPPGVLNKEGKLTDEEFETMRTHTSQGAELLQSCGVAPAVVAMAYQHHERVDGNGYPQKLKGSEIHPFAKIVAIADVYDAITSNRPHQEKMSAEEAMRRMRSDEGLFDQEFLGKLSFDKIMK